MNSSSNLINALFIFVLAGFIGFEVIRRVSPLLHTPLMSLTNALDAIAVVGAILLVGEHKSTLSTVFGFVAVVAATDTLRSSVPDRCGTTSAGSGPYGCHVAGSAPRPSSSSVAGGRTTAARRSVPARRARRRMSLQDGVATACNPFPNER